MNKKSVVALLLAVCLLLTGLVGCGNKEPDPVEPGVANTITVKNAAGNPVEGVEVYVYQDNTLAEMVAFAQTNAEGKITYTAEGEGEVAVIKNAAIGYQVEESYPITGADTVITLNALAPTADGKLPADVTIELGQPMVDFTITDVDGTTYTASEVLKEKKALVLNFWYTGCQPCGMEFPYLQKAYENYTDDLVLLALDSYEEDTADSIKAYRDDKQLTMPMADVEGAWVNLLGFTAYPTTYVIDRYGFVVFAHTGAVTEEGVFEQLFAYYAAEDYVQKVATDVSELETAPVGEPGSSAENPIEVGGTLTFDATVPVGGMVYYDVYRISGTILTIDNANAYVVYNEQVYESVDGKVSFPVHTDDVTIPVKLVIGNKGSEEAVFTVNFAYPGGTLANPFDVVMGDLTTIVEAGNDQGVVYKYTATADGTIEMYVADVDKNVKYDLTLYNLNSYANRSLEADGVEKDGKKKVIVEVKKGDEVQVIVATLPNEENKYPAATIKSRLDFVDVNGSTTSSSGTGAVNTTPSTGAPTVTGKPVGSVTLPTSAPTQATGGTTTAKPSTTKNPTTTTEAGTTTTVPTLESQKNVTYKVTVKADGKALSGVSVTFAAAGKTKTVTTDSKGVASASFVANVCLATLTLPDGYIADALQLSLSDMKTSGAFNLTKEQEPEQEEPGNIPTEYQVKVVLSNGVAFAGINVQFWRDDTMVAEQKADKNGVAKVSLMDGTYSVKLAGTDMKYDEQAARVSAAKPSTEILLANPCGTKKERIECPVVNKARPAFFVEEGATYVTLNPGQRNYFLFTPAKSGTYRVSTVSAGVKVGYYGGSIHYIVTENMADPERVDENGTAFSVSVKDPGPSFVLGLDAASNVEGTVLLITRIGNAEWSVADEPWITYSGSHDPKKYTLPAGTTLKKVDITAGNFKIVLGSDGFYHKDTKNGPLVFLKFKGTDYVAFDDILNNFHIAAYLYNNNGSFLRKEEYTVLMEKYRDCADSKESVYPLTKDLEYILKKYGEHQGWWKTKSPGYLFKDENQNPIVVNEDIAWMFAVYYAG